METHLYRYILRRSLKLQVIQYQDRIEFIPRRALRQMRGFLKGLDTSVPRESDRP